MHMRNRRPHLTRRRSWLTQHAMVGQLVFPSQCGTARATLKEGGPTCAVLISCSGTPCHSQFVSTNARRRTSPPAVRGTGGVSRRATGRQQQYIGTVAELDLCTATHQLKAGGHCDARASRAAARCAPGTGEDLISRWLHEGHRIGDALVVLQLLAARHARARKLTTKVSALEHAAA